MDNGNDSLNFKNIQDDVIGTLLVLVNYLRNPITGMKNLPEWPWQKLVILSGALAAVCGILKALLAGSIFAIFVAPILYPISTLLMLFVFSGFFYYVFLFFYRRELSFFTIFTMLVFATIPAQILSTISPIMPPVTLLGVAVTGLLLIVGFVENFQLPKKSMTKLMTALFIAYVIIWISSSISFHRSKERFEESTSPLSTEILEREFGTD